MESKANHRPAILAIGTSFGLAAIDVVYVVRETIARIYLVDAAMELLLVVLWIIAMLKTRRGVVS